MWTPSGCCCAGRWSVCVARVNPTWLLLIRESPAVFELLPGKDKSLLIGGDALFVLDLCLDIVDRVRGFDLEGNRLAGQRLDEDLHTATETEDEMERRLLLDIALENVCITTRWTCKCGLLVRKSPSVLELFAGEDQPLLIGGNTLLILNLRLHIVDSIRRLDFKGNRLARQGLDEDLHATAET